MTGEMLSISSNNEEYYFHSAVAKELGGKVMPFNKFQGPYVLIGRARLLLISDKQFPEVLCRWHNETNNKVSSAFPDGKSKARIWLAVDAAREVI